MTSSILVHCMCLIVRKDICRLVYLSMSCLFFERRRRTFRVNTICKRAFDYGTAGRNLESRNALLKDIKSL